MTTRRNNNGKKQRRKKQNIKLYRNKPADARTRVIDLRGTLDFPHGKFAKKPNCLWLNFFNYPKGWILKMDYGATQIYATEYQ